MNNNIGWLAFGLAVVLGAAAASADTYTYRDLVKRLTDLQQLGKLPPDGEKTSLASSYDRRSRYDAATDRYIDWDANNDGSGIVRKEGDGSVFMDVKGPGCIWRTWTATAGAGHVKVFLDGVDTPVVDLAFASYFDGKTSPFNRPSLVYNLSPGARGFDNYTPIPFQKSCKIVGDRGWGNYYQFTYTQFPPGTVVPTFTLDLSGEDSAALDEADNVLAHCGPMTGALNSHTEMKTLRIEPGKSEPALDLSEAGAITAIKLKLDLPKDPEAQRILLRQLTISMTWDHDADCAVWSPVGDFFGYVGGADKFRSLPTGLIDNTFYANWYMPFGQRAKIEIGNDGPTAVPVTIEITHESLTQPIATLARFHAKWHRDAFLTNRPDRAPDWTLLTAKGRGRYVGTHLHGWNPRGDWWGEGDDKFFVDGEKFPSSFGTGSEDYFGYAWGVADHFSRPYHNQLLNEDNAGHFDDNRWHIPDSVPFTTSLDADLEKYFGNDRPTLFAAEVFFYLSGNGIDPYRPVPVSERVGYWVRPPVYHEPDAIEAESLHVATKPVHPARKQEMLAFGNSWSNDQQVLWAPTELGETLELRLPAQKAGRYRLTARYTLAPDYGIFQASLNNKEAGARLDLYKPQVVARDAIDLGFVSLEDGTPVFKLTVVGKNPASRGMLLGLDYLKLTPVK